MKIERIDDKTVKCFLTNEELEAYQITYKDFIMRSEKAKEVVEDIIIQAEEEVGFQPPKISLDLQIMMLPDQGMMLTFTEKELDEETSGLVTDYMQCINELEGNQEGNKAISSEEGGQTMEKEIPASESHKVKESKKSQTNKEIIEKAAPKQAVFAFDSLTNVCDYVSILPGNLRVKSAFYKWGDTYYVHIERAAASHDRYGRICIRALEFGRLYSADQKKICYLAEQARCILQERALNKLRRLCQEQRGEWI